MPVPTIEVQLPRAMAAAPFFWQGAIQMCMSRALRSGTGAQQMSCGRIGHCGRCVSESLGSMLGDTARVRWKEGSGGAFPKDPLPLARRLDPAGHFLNIDTHAQA